MEAIKVQWKKKVCVLEVDYGEKQDIHCAFAGLGSNNCCTVDEKLSIYDENASDKATVK